MAAPKKNTKVFWTDDEILKLYPVWREGVLKGEYTAAALDAAQRGLLSADRWRSINSAAVAMVRENGKILLEEAQKILPQHTAEEPKPLPEPEPEPEPAPEPERPEPGLRERILDTVVMLLEDRRVQNALLQIGARLLSESLKPTAPVRADAAVPKKPAPPAIKRPIVIVGPDAKQIGLIDEEFRRRLHLTFFVDSDSKEAIRNATKNAEYAISTLPRPNGPVDMILRANLPIRDNYKHISGIGHLREFLAKVANGVRA